MAATSVTSAASAAASPPTRTADKSRPIRVGAVAGLAIAHVVLALLMRMSPGIATAHALITVALATFLAATTRQLTQIAPVVGYLAGCEVLWRMSKADVFWEFGKYAIALILVIGILRIRIRRNRLVPVAYFALLLPSMLLTFVGLDLDAARQAISFTLAGPLAIALAVLFFSNIRLTSQQVGATFLAFVLPVLGISALVFRTAAAHTDVEFVNAANSATSGGFGPNQVSPVLGLALMFVLLFVLTRRLPWGLRLPLIALATTLAGQTALTFARGGLVAALAGVAAAMFILMRGNPRARISVLVIGILAIGITKLVIEPKLEAITNGEISERYSSTKSSGRDLFVKGELEFFAENPVLGVGPGMGAYLRSQRDMFAGPSHTEYSRLLAEHGLLGLLSLGCLIAMCVRAARHSRDVTSRALSLAMVVWFALFLLVYSTRLATPAFVLGLACATPLASRPPPKKSVVS